MVQGNRTGKFLIAVVMGVILLAMGAANVIWDRNMALGQESDADSAVYQYHIAMIGSSPYDEFWASVYEGANETGKACGAFVENFGQGLEADYTVEELMQMAIAAKVDGIIVEADKGDGMKEWIDLAAGEGIPVMTILSDAPNSSRISFVSGNSYALGEVYGSQILEAVQERGREEGAPKAAKVAVLINAGGKNSQQGLIYSGIREAVSASPERMNLSTVSIDSQGRFESEETVRNLVLGEERPDILVCLSAVDTISAYQCVVDYNMVGKITIIGYYSSEETLEEIRRGVVKPTISINAGEMGKTAAEGMYDFLTKEHVSEYLPVASELITLENVGSYIEGAEKEGIKGGRL